MATDTPDARMLPVASRYCYCVCDKKRRKHPGVRLQLFPKDARRDTNKKAPTKHHLQAAYANTANGAGGWPYYLNLPPGLAIACRCSARRNASLRKSLLINTGLRQPWRTPGLADHWELQHVPRIGRVFFPHDARGLKNLVYNPPPAPHATSAQSGGGLYVLLGAAGLLQMGIRKMVSQKPQSELWRRRSMYGGVCLIPLRGAQKRLIEGYRNPNAKPLILLLKRSLDARSYFTHPLPRYLA
ncbi:hypothetical protein GWK47_025161 [Chionoecetes opilio]|uniref:Uncharacterized protein n=1 Tax=Chionoecetes opilio TaxID=41210 RepID=A0A8J4XKJ5_CHIOP|nr:hypothetical protein GWK47_025161 [Chionoecetes opilio]